MKKRYAFTDVETTGLRPDWHEIIEVGCVVFEYPFEIIETFSAKVRPVFPQRIDPAAQAVNGFLEKNWRDAPGAHETWRKFAKMTDGAIFVAQNVIFDWSFIQQVVKQQPTIKFNFDRQRLDLMSMAYSDGAHNLSLKALCAHYGVKPEPKIHTALNGAMTGFEVFKAIMQKDI